MASAVNMALRTYLCHGQESLQEGFEQITRMANSKYKNDSSVYIEKYINSACHIEVQVFGDGIMFKFSFRQPQILLSWAIYCLVTIVNGSPAPTFMNKKFVQAIVLGHGR